jgi:hypothetical protein
VIFRLFRTAPVLCQIFCLISETKGMYQMGIHTRLRTKRSLLNDTLRCPSLLNITLYHWFLALRGEILVSSSSTKVLKKRLCHFHGLCGIKFLIGMNKKLGNRGRKLS